MRKFLVTAGKFGLGAVAIAYLLYSGKIDLSLLPRVRENWIWLVPANVIVLLLIFVTTLRWQILLRAVGVEIPFLRALRLTWIGYFFNTFIPGAVGGDFVKAYYAAQESEGKRAAAVAAVFADRFIGLASMFLVPLVALALNTAFLSENVALRQVFVYSMVILVVVAAGTALVFSRLVKGSRFTGWFKARLPFTDKFQALYDELYLFRARPRALLIALLISAVNHASLIVVFWCFGKALGGAGIPWRLLFVVVPVGLIFNALPISVGGLGVGEGAFEKLYGWATGTTESLGGEACLLFHVTLILWNLCGLVPYLKGRAELPKEALTAPGAAVPSAEQHDAK